MKKAIVSILANIPREFVTELLCPFGVWEKAYINTNGVVIFEHVGKYGHTEEKVINRFSMDIELILCEKIKKWARKNNLVSKIDWSMDSIDIISASIPVFLHLKKDKE